MHISWIVDKSLAETAKIKPLKNFLYIKKIIQLYRWLYHANTCMQGHVYLAISNAVASRVFSSFPTPPPPPPQQWSDKLPTQFAPKKGGHMVPQLLFLKTKLPSSMCFHTMSFSKFPIFAILYFLIIKITSLL